MPKSEIYALVGKVRDKTIPGSDVIVRTALAELGLTGAFTLTPGGKSPDDVLKNFDAYLRQVFEKSLVVLERFEAQCYPQVLRELAKLRADKLNAIERGRQRPLSDKVADALDVLYPDLWQVFLSRSNSRKQRGGKDFEEQLGQLLAIAEVPFDPQIKTFHSDFILPSIEFFNRDKTRAMLISAKRTLRERWQNLVNEIYETRCPNAYLATADEAISKEVIDRMRRYNLHLVVWDSVKAEKFATEPVVLGFTQLANEEIATFRPRWSQAEPRSREDTRRSSPS